jgi:hypothetical protein
VSGTKATPRQTPTALLREELKAAQAERDAALAEAKWLAAKLGTAHGFGVPCTHVGGEALLVTLLRNGDRWAIVRHRPMGAQVWLNDAWWDVHYVPDSAYLYTAVEAHRIADERIAAEAAEDAAWRARRGDLPADLDDELLAEYASDRTVSA